MKIPTPDGFVIDVEAPVLPAFAVKNRWIVWCTECGDWHRHGAGEGHREGHCNGATKYSRTGYNLALAGKMTEKEANAESERRRSGSKVKSDAVMTRLQDRDQVGRQHLAPPSVFPSPQRRS